MNAPVRKPPAVPALVDVFIARAEARALLYAAGELELHDALDKLQADAERDGLVAELGQDEVQRLIAEAFAKVRDDLLKSQEISTDFAEDAWNAPGWREAAIEYHEAR